MNIDNTGFVSYIYSSWLTKYLWKAYRKGITIDDVPPVSPLDSCSYNLQKFEHLWNDELSRRGPTSASLPLVAWRFVRFRVLISLVLNSCSRIISFIFQTILLRKLLEYSEGSDINFFWGMHWVLYIVAFDLLQMTLHTWSNIMNQRTALRLKAACLSLVFKKVVNLNSMTNSRTNELVSRLSMDGQKIYEAVNFGTSIVDGPIVTLCAVICISVWLHPSALMGLLVCLLFYVFQYWFRHLVDFCKCSANTYAMARIDRINEVLSNIRLIKINGWEQNFVQNILNIRHRESKWLWKLSFVKSLNASTMDAIPIIVVIVTFFMHFTISHHLRASVAFPLCVLIIVQIHGSFLATKKSLFHLKESLITFKKMKKGLLMEDTGCHASKPYEASQAVAIINGTFVYDIFKKQSHQSENGKNTKKNYNIDNNIGDPEKQKLTTPEFEPKRIEILSNITFKAKKGQLIGVSGKAKSGKSSLLLAALGQIKMTNGQLMRQGSCAYVGQKAWLANATIRENILFDEAYDAKKYYEAQVVCKLRQDVKKLPEGDETEIGDGGGVDLPEDMKQRVALARAFYADRDIYFLDDPLGSFDDGDSEEIFENLIISALAEKTIIFVTDDVEYLDRCDFMYIMRDGAITEHGTHKELMRLGREYAAMVKAAATDVRSDSSKDSSSTPDNNSERERDRRKSNVEESRHLLATYYYNSNSNNNNNNNNDDADKVNRHCCEDDIALSFENDFTPKSITALTYFTYLKSLGSYLLIIPVIISYAIYGSTGVLSLLRLTWLVKVDNGENVTMQISEKDVTTTYNNWYGLCFFLVIFGCVVQSFIVQFTTIRIADNMHNALLNKLMQAPVNFFDLAPKKIQDLLLHDIYNVSFSLPTNLDNTLRWTVVGFFTFFVLISTVPWFTNYIVLASIVYFFIVKVYRAGYVNIKHLEYTVKSEINEFLINSVQGLNTVRIFKKEHDLLSKFQVLVDHQSTCCFLKGVAEKWYSIRLQILTTTCLLVAMSLIVVLKNEISPALAGLTLVYIFQVPNIIQRGIISLKKTENYFGSVQNICEFLQTLSSEFDNKTAAIAPDAEWPSTGLIEFENVQLRYNNDTQFAPDHTSFTINNAEKIGILDKTESGKDIIGAVYRLYELKGGKITIDKTDISKINVNLLRRKLSIIPEEPIFHGTIRFFLDPIKRHTDPELWSALERVHLKDKISSFSSQLHYLIDGNNFNIGEKQLLFLAKAFLRQNKIVLLEENASTSSASFLSIQQVLEREFSSSTILIFTQHLHTVFSCDRVLIIEDGQDVEFDSPSNLLANENSRLKQMVAEDDEMRSRRYV